MRLASVLFLTLLLSSPLAAQVESPVPFDSAGQIMSVTPSQAQRMRLAAPAWPVVGDFREARVYLAGAERFVLVVERPDGARERFPMSASEYEALRGLVSGAVGNRAAPAPASPPAEPAPRMTGASPARATTRARPAMDAEDGDVSRAAFTSRMMMAAFMIYGPAAATIVGEAAGGTAAYLGVVSGSFFASYAASRQGTSRAQMDLATDMAARGAMAGWLVSELLGARQAKQQASSMFLVGLGSVVTSYNVARSLTASEVAATTYGSTAATATALGVLGGVGSLRNFGRGDAAVLLAAGAAGLPAGLWYKRVAPHQITSGDVRAISVGGALGALSGLTVVSRLRDPGEKVSSLALTAGFLGGIVAGDQFFARPYDFTRAEGAILGLGTIAGGLAGAAPFVIANENEPDTWLVGATLGALLGAWGTTVLSDPAPGTPNRTASDKARDRQVGRLTMHPLNAAFATARMKGTFPLLSLKF